MRTQLLVLALCLTLARAGVATVLNIPSEFQDIASAMDHAGPGDTLLLDSGLYSGPGFMDLRIETPGGLTIATAHGSQHTVIDLESGPFLAVGDSLSGTDTVEVLLEGLAITNGSTVAEVRFRSSVTARGCLFADNTQAFSVSGSDASVLLDSCHLAGHEYAVVLMDSADFSAINTHFRSNYCAIWAYPETITSIERCMFFYHDWTMVFEGSTADISRSLLHLNFVGIKGSDTLESDINVSCSNVFSRFAFNYSDTPDQTGMNGNLSFDPLFCDTTAETSLNVAAISPLLPENNECGLPIGHVETGCCCVGSLGNIDYDNQDIVDIADVQAMVDNLFLSLTPLSCFEEGDLNFDSWIDITDLQILIDNQFLTLTPLNRCR